MHNKKNNICRVCGLLQKSLPWGENGNSPSFEICNCCGVEFGYEDSSIESIRQFRDNWITSGANWFNYKEKPYGWKLEKQLKNVAKKYL